MEYTAPRVQVRSRAYKISKSNPTQQDIDFIMSMTIAQYGWLVWNEQLLNGWIYFKSQRTVSAVRTLDTTMVFTPFAATDSYAYENEVVTRLPNHQFCEFGDRPRPGRRTDIENDVIYQETKKMVQEAQRKKREALEKACPQHAAYWKKVKDLKLKHNK